MQHFIIALPSTSKKYSKHTKYLKTALVQQFMHMKKVKNKAHDTKKITQRILTSLKSITNTFFKVLFVF